MARIIVLNIIKAQSSTRTNRTSAQLMVLLVVLLAMAVPAQAEDPADDPLEPLGFFIGTWTGQEKASFGDGEGGRSYERAIGERYLLGRNKSVFPPQEGLPEGDIHEDWTFFSYDSGRGTFVVRQLNSEGYINTFVLEDKTTMPKTMRFVLVDSENGPPGIKGHLAFERISNDEFTEEFKLIMPGSDRELLFRNRWIRVTD